MEEQTDFGGEVNRDRAALHQQVGDCFKMTSHAAVNVSNGVV